MIICLFLDNFIHVQEEEEEKKKKNVRIRYRLVALKLPNEPRSDSVGTLWLICVKSAVYPWHARYVVTPFCALATVQSNDL